MKGKKKAPKPVRKAAKKGKDSKRSKSGHFEIINQTVRPSPKLKALQMSAFSSIPTAELEKLQAHGLLPFEMRKELQKRKG
ncbi:MAG: hypothetical protein V1847_04185 [Candidatus Diapherotrites archaeon]